MAKKKTPITTALQDSIQEAVEETVRNSIEAVSKEIGDYLDPHIRFTNHKAYFCVQHLELHDLYKDISIDELFKTVITDSNDIDGDCDEENVADNIRAIEHLAKELETNVLRLRKHAAHLKTLKPCPTPKAPGASTRPSTSSSTPVTQKPRCASFTQSPASSSTKPSVTS